MKDLHTIQVIAEITLDIKKFKLKEAYFDMHTFRIHPFLTQKYEIENLKSKKNSVIDN